jgi:hypothetical protein
VDEHSNQYLAHDSISYSVRPSGDKVGVPSFPGPEITSGAKIGGAGVAEAVPRKMMLEHAWNACPDRNLSPKRSVPRFFCVDQNTGTRSSAG